MGLLQKPRREKRGIKVLAYGVSGAGKTWFTLSFPKCAMIDTEDGSAHYVDNPNMALRLVTTSAVDVEEALTEIKDDHADDVDTIIIDSETKMYENLQHSALVVAERRARENGRSAFGEGLSLKEWQKIKLIHKRINSKLIELSGMGKNVIVITQLSDERQKMGDEFIKVGEKPNGIKGLEYDFDIILKLCYDKETRRRWGVVEKDRTGTYQNGQEIDNVSFENWKHVYEGSKSLEASTMNLNKDIEQDAVEFADTLPELIQEIKDVANSKFKAKKLTQAQATDILKKFKLENLDQIDSVELAKQALEVFNKV